MTTLERRRKQIDVSAQRADGLSRFQIYKERLPLATIGAFEVLLGWVLMLVVMTFNASLLLATAVGSLIGLFFFDRKGSHTK